MICQARASIKTWLYRIATNVCLDALSDESRRFRPFEEGPSNMTEHLETRERTHWLEPIPDARVLPAHADPSSSRRCGRAFAWHSSRRCSISRRSSARR
jgi:DNA-directed RNA polymerase specialized sigma24 family protein